MRTIKTLEKKIQDAISSGVNPGNINRNLSTIAIGDAITIKGELMGLSVGKGFFTPRGASRLGKLPGEATGLLEKATGTFIFKGFDTNGKAILHEITTFPTL